MSSLLRIEEERKEELRKKNIEWDEEGEWEGKEGEVDEDRYEKREEIPFGLFSQEMYD